ncbi:IclR family transcriptional regulator [Curvibacter sp. HBC28]|uniref:IclR family transcriptional regulator n=1 Tax=Curvibacter microcysteis TaxID=3026419 RepID=A0ABT5MCT3_9BURK|nr:IclR family transcriptional regulator [Curvibacter sp. HBC28]MDD0814389.1 IclR family transcriptional regulator [Curvibacter sp. HBC28]
MPVGLEAAPATDRALQVLSVLAQHREPLSALELSAATGLAKSTLYRQIATLRRWGFVMEVDGRYGPGPASVELASGFDANSRLVQCARADMQSLSRLSSESVALVAVLNERAVCLEMVDSVQSLRCSFDKGRSVPLRDGASAKCLLAHLPEAARSSALDRLGLSAAERMAREAELSAIRERGHALSSGEVDAGVWGVSVPLLDAQRQLLGAITLMAPTLRSTGREAAFVHMTLVSAARIARALQSF